jgi:glutaredoxin
LLYLSLQATKATQISSKTAPLRSMPRVLFTVSGCGSPCSDANNFLSRRHVNYEEIVVTDGKEEEKKWERYGAITTMPVLVVGDVTISGFNKWNYVSTLALNYDNEYLTGSEAEIFDKNFGPDGEPKLVMYTMDGCGYCEQAIRQLREDGIQFEERNSSASYRAKKELDKLESGTPLIYYGYRRFTGWSSNIYKSLKAVL